MTGTTFSSDPVALIEHRAASNGDGSLSAVWDELVAATEGERTDFLAAVLDAYAAHQDAERAASLQRFIADAVAEAMCPKDSQQ